MAIKVGDALAGTGLAGAFQTEFKAIVGEFSSAEVEKITATFCDAMARSIDSALFPWEPKVTGVGPHTLVQGSNNRYDNSSGVAQELHFPANPADGDELDIKEVGDSTNAVILTTNAGNVDIEDLALSGTVTSDSLSLAHLSAKYKWDAADDVWRLLYAIG